jgi:hypothetical protein
VEKITFVKVAYNSLLSPTFTPISYNYKIPMVTNSRLYQMPVRRTITAPDIIFAAANLIDSEALPNYTPLTRSGSFVSTTNVALGVGATNVGVLPSTISASMLIVFDNVGPIYYNENPYFMDSLNYYQYPIFNWGSFDGSTNAPILYPNGSSLAELEAQVLQGGATIPVYPWAPVLNATATNTTTSGGAPGG